MQVEEFLENSASRSPDKTALVADGRRVTYAQLEGVAEAAVVGVPDDILGQAIKAVIKIKQGSALNEQDVLRHCAAHLENFMVPKHVEFRDQPPRTSTGKISKRELV